MLSSTIPFLPPEKLESHTDTNSGTPITFRGYTAESFLAAVAECGPIFETEVNGEKEVVFAGLEANELAWRNPDDWSYHDAVSVFREELSFLHLTQLDRDAHRRKRRLLNKGFKTSSVMTDLPAIAKTISEEIAGFVGKKVELHEALMEVLTRAQSVSAIKEALSDEDISKMVDFEEGFIGALFKKKHERELIYNRASYTEKKREVLGRLHGIVQSRMDQDGSKDMLDTLINQKVSQSVEPLSEEELIYDAYLLLIAGTGNTSKTICYLLHSLSQSPEWLERLCEEVKGFNAESLSQGMSNFPLMKATLMEAERLFPAAPVLPRVPFHDIEFLGFPLAEGTHCLHLASLMHFDPSVYEDPFAFKPQRWIDNEYPKQAHGTFGGGSHICLGMNVARIHMPLVLGYLLSEYTFTVSGVPRVENYAYPGEIDSQTVRMEFELEAK